MPFYTKGDVRIRYEEAGSGFPLLVTPGGGLNSRVSNWATAVFNAILFPVVKCAQLGLLKLATPGPLMFTILKVTNAKPPTTAHRHHHRQPQHVANRKTEHRGGSPLLL